MSGNPDIVLLTEHPETLLAVRSVLTALGATVAQVSSAVELFRYLDRDEIPGVVLDARDDPEAWLETAHRLRLHETSRATPLLFILPEDAPECVVEAAAGLGPVDFLLGTAPGALLRVRLSNFLKLAGLGQTGVDVPAGEQAQIILESVTDAFFALDRDWRFVYVNSQAEHLLDRPRAELLGRGIWEEFAPALGTEFDRAYHEVMEQRVPLSFEAFYEPHERWYEVHVYPSPTGISVYFRSISDRKRNEALLRGQKRILEQMVAGASLKETLETVALVMEEQADGPALACIHLLSEDGTYLHRVAAPTLASVIGRAFETVPVGPAAGCSGAAAFRNETVVIPDVASDADCSEGCGEAAAGKVQACWATPIRAENGEVLGTLTVYRQKPHVPAAQEQSVGEILARTAAVEIERKRAEEALRVSDERLQLLLGHSTDFAAIIMDPEGRIQEWKGAAEHITGWREEEVLGKSVSLLFTPEDRAAGRPQEEMRVATESGRAEDKRWHIKKDGTRFFADGVLVSLHGPGGELWGFGKLFRDATRRQRAEQELARVRGEAERLQRLHETILSSTPDLVYVFDLNHRFVYANQALLAMWGKSWDEAIGKTCLELGYEPWQAAMHDREIDTVIETRQPIRGEVPFTGTQGRRIYDYIFVPVLGVDGQVEAIAGTTRDVTERKQAEEALQQSEEQYRTLVESITDAFYALDREWRFTYVNNQAERYFHRTREEVLGKVVWDLFPETKGSQFEEQYRAAVREQRSVHFEVYSSFSQRWVEVHAYPWSGGLSVGFRDITDRRRREEEERFLMRLHEETRLLSEPVEIMATVTRLLGEYMKVSRCAYAPVEEDGENFTVEGDYNRDCKSIVGRYPLHAFGDRAVRDLRAGKPYVVHDIEREAPPGTDLSAYRLTEIRAVVCVSLIKAGQLVALMAVHQTTPRQWTPEEVRLLEMVADRSWSLIERVKTSKELQEANRAKDDFLAMLAHELRNPLAPITTAAHILGLSCPDNPLVQRQGKLIERQTRHLARLMDDLLDVSRITRGKVTLHKTVMDLREAVAQAVEALQPLMAERRHQLSVDLPDRPVTVEADEVRMGQILSNLLHNAAKYTDPGGQVCVRLGSEENTAVLTVSDNGQGIDADFLPRVWDLFRQGERGLDRAQGGLGIGLTLVKTLVELHGGTAQAWSEGPGRGSVFTIRLPVAEAEGCSAAPSALTLDHQQLSATTHSTLTGG